MDIQTDRWANGLADRQTHRQADMQVGSQTDRLLSDLPICVFVWFLTDKLVSGWALTGEQMFG